MSEFSVSPDWLLMGKTEQEKIDFEAKTDTAYLRLVWLVDLYDKLIKLDAGVYDKYLQEIIGMIHQIKQGKRTAIQSNCKLIYESLESEFDYLFREYYTKVLSERAKELKTFNPPRYFAKVKLDLD